MLDILIKKTNIIAMASAKPEIKYHMDIAIKDGIITKIGKNITDKAKKVVDGYNTFSLPGFINCHCHIGATIFQGTDAGIELTKWLNEICWPIEKKMTDNDILIISKLAIAESLSNGITTINDMYFKNFILYDLFNTFHVSTYCCKGVMDINDKGTNSFLEEQYLLNHISIDNEHVLFGIHGLYTSSPAYVQKCVKFASENKLKIHMHFCENENEIKIIKQKHKMTPGQCLKKYFNGFKEKIILAHGVVLTDDDINVLKSMPNISIAHCPVSNLKLGCGFMNLQKLLKNNINVCIGTDGAGSATKLSILDNIRTSLLMQYGLNKNGNIISSYEMLKIATINGAKALGIQNKVGTIEVGKKANIQLYHFNNFEMFPISNPIDNIVFSAHSSDIIYVITNGYIEVEKYRIKSINKTKAINDVKAVYKRLFVK